MKFHPIIIFLAFKARSGSLLPSLQSASDVGLKLLTNIKVIKCRHIFDILQKTAQQKVSVFNLGRLKLPKYIYSKNIALY